MANSLVNMYYPDVVSRPGETLEELLDDREMTQADLAERTGRSKKTINEIIQGKTAITPETAIQLERVLGVPASFWLAREQHYREYKARQQDDAHLADYDTWLEDEAIPVKEMVRAGWIEAHPEPVAQLREVLAFFGIASPAQHTVMMAAFRRSAAFQSDSGAVAAWLRQGERLAHQCPVAPFDESAFRDVLNQARALTRDPFSSARVALARLCAQAGVVVVIVPEIARTRVCGATRWLTPSKALIQLSLRYRTDDQFWFTFFHEAGHILLHGKRAAFLDEEQHAEDQQEDEANRFAADLLIPPADMQRLRQRGGKSYYSQKMIVHFAEEIGIAPGIIVGRLQHDRLLPPTHLNRLKAAIVE